MLAGVFGLEIYVIGLREPSVTDEDLLALFNLLPRRCIMLLEDIDTAGLARSSYEQDDKDNLVVNNGERSDLKVKTPKENGSGVRRRGRLDDDEGISLLGLLNAIDGVASYEGRVLIMTTNKPKVLDEALVRPGRVDMQVEFTFATEKQAGELFERMYEVNSKECSANFIDIDGNYMTTEEMKTAAAHFAAKIPAGFSLAELKGFLMNMKKDPRRALQEVGTWVNEILDKKAS